MTVVALAALVAAVAGMGFGLWTLRQALQSVTLVFDRVEARAHAERHTLAGRLQRPDLFPTAPAATVEPRPASDPGDGGPTDLAAFEAAGRDLDGMTDKQLAAIFGEDKARELQRG